MKRLLSRMLDPQEFLGDYGIRAMSHCRLHHLRDACLGSVSEILEGDAPHRPLGCVAQAWGVAEPLRVCCGRSPVPKG